MSRFLTRIKLFAVLSGLVSGVPFFLAGQGDAARGAGEPLRRSFSFIALGDMHFDRLEHHDMAWLEREHPNDVRQVQNYSRLTETVWPGLFAELREVIAREKPPVAFAAQLGDFTEGLCGTPELARKQCRDAVTFVREAKLGVPFLITKGNHDITGPGAREAYESVLLPFIGAQAGQTLSRASFIYRKGEALFVFYDAYTPESLPWLEETLARERARHLFVLLHPPVVPFAARSLWHIYARPEQAPQRQRLLEVLGKHRAIVLSAHLHRYGVVVRRTGGGRFVQLALNSVIPSAGVEPKQVVSGLKRYGPDLVELEPRFQPQTAADRRAALQAEAPFIEYFEYADAPGYAVISVEGPRVRAKLFSGLGHRRWKTLDLTRLLRGR